MEHLDCGVFDLKATVCNWLKHHENEEDRSINSPHSKSARRSKAAASICFLHVSSKVSAGSIRSNVSQHYGKSS